MTQRVVVTRPRSPADGAERLCRRIEGLGYEPFLLPVLECVSVDPDETVRMQLQHLVTGHFSWVIFLSPSAVHFLTALLEREHDLRQVSGVRIAAQGPGTASAVQKILGRSPDFVPSVSVAEDLVREFADISQRREKILVPQSAQGRNVVAPYLSDLGHEVAVFSAYQLVKVTPSSDLLEELLRYPPEKTVYTFLSPSAVDATLDTLGGHRAHLEGARVISIGPLTSHALRERGVTTFEEAANNSQGGVLALLSCSTDPAVP